MNKSNKSTNNTVLLLIIVLAGFILLSKTTYSGQTVRYTYPQATGYQQQAVANQVTYQGVLKMLNNCYIAGGAGSPISTTGNQLCSTTYGPSGQAGTCIATYYQDNYGASSPPWGIKSELAPCSALVQSTGTTGLGVFAICCTPR